MRARFTTLALLCGLATAALPAAAGAAPHHNRGLTINVTPNPILAGEGVLIYGQLNGTPDAGQTVRLYHRVNPHGHFSLIGVTTTSSTGFYEFPRAEGIVRSNRSWFVRGPNHSHSRTVHERVAALVTLAADSATGTTTRVIGFTGHLTPDHRFQHVLLQEQGAVTGNGWRTIARGLTNGASDFAIAHRFSQPGDYTLRAYFPADPRNIAGESDGVTVTIQQAQVTGFTIASSAPTVPEGQPVTVSGVLDKAGTTTPAPATQVTLYGRQDEGSFEALATAVTGSDGSYGFTETPVHNTVYYVGETLTPKRHTTRLYEGVQDALTIASSSPSAAVGGSVTITGTVSPAKTGHAIWLQRLAADGHWHDVARGAVGTGSSYSFSYTFGQIGTVELRARIYGGPENVGAASAPVTIAVSGIAPVTSLPPAS